MPSPTGFIAGVAVGINALSAQDQQRMQDAGLGWLRSGIHGLDQGCVYRGEKQPQAFHDARAKIIELRKSGFQIMGLTPGPHNMTAEAGTPGSSEYFGNYRKVCTFLGEQFRGLIDYWQVANEVDIWIFREKLTLEQAAEFVKVGLRALKAVDSNLKVGTNITLYPSKPGEVDGNTDRHEGVFIAQSIYGDPTLQTDYIGFDSYPGTWREGGPESWHEYLDSLHKLTGKPIIIQEFGYSSAGEVMSDAESQTGIYPCKAGKWRFSWKGGHTPQAQADFITESYRIFAQKPYVIGAIYFRWNDQETCWQCGQAGCPIETAWGLVTLKDELKPSYHSLKASLACFADRS